MFRSRTFLEVGTKGRLARRGRFPGADGSGRGAHGQKENDAEVWSVQEQSVQVGRREGNTARCMQAGLQRLGAVSRARRYNARGLGLREGGRAGKHPGRADGDERARKKGRAAKRAGSKPRLGALLSYGQQQDGRAGSAEVMAGRLRLHLLPPSSSTSSLVGFFRVQQQIWLARSLAALFA
ncbi:unnamed protein product [Calypogeia fissa]